MSEIIGGGAARRQPSGPVSVNPEWAGRLLSLVHFGGGTPVDVVDRAAKYALAGSARIGGGTGGRGLRTGAGTLDYIEATGALANYSGNVTIVAHFLDIGPLQDSNGGIWWAVPAGSIYYQITATGDGVYVGGSTLSFGEDIRGTKRRTLIVNSAGTQLFLDHKLISTNYATTPLPVGGKTVRIGAYSGANWSFKGVIGSIAVIKGNISNAEAHAWVDNPWLGYAEPDSSLTFLPTFAPTATGTTTVTEIETWRVFEGAAGSAQVTISGSHTGGTDSIEVQIETEGGATVVPWQTLQASVPVGAFSGTITVPRGGWYKARVRRAGDTGAQAVQAQKWGVGIILGGFGQSQLVGFATGGTVGAVDARAVTHDGTSWQQMTTTGVGRNTFAQTLAGIANCPVAVITEAQSGTAISLWWSGGEKTAWWTQWSSKVAAAGGKLSAFVLWQGEGDANISRTKAAYKADIDAIFSQLRTDYGAGLPVVVANLGRYTGDVVPPTDDDYEAIRDAHVDAANDAGNWGFVTYDQPLADTAHFSTGALVVLANRLAQCVANAYGLVAYSRGPRLLSATRVATNQVDVNLQHDGGTDFTPTTGITGFQVLDGGTPVTISSAVRQSATKIRLTLASTPAGTVTVRYMYGKNPTISGAVVDNSGLALPLITPDADLLAQGRKVLLNCLQRVGGAAAASVTGLRWAFFDQSTPNALTAPAVTGTAESTDGAGVLEIDVIGTSLEIGQTGYLVTDTATGVGFCGPVQVSG